MSKLRFILIMILLLMCAGCKNSIDSMLDDYNSNFTIDTSIYETTPSPGDEDFIESGMLLDTYCVGSNETINLAAPYKCDSYSWVVTDPLDANNEVTVKFFDGSMICNSRLFVTYIPESGLKAGRTYKLTLTVTDKEGNAYKDFCELVIYQHFEFYEEE